MSHSRKSSTRKWINQKPSLTEGMLHFEQEKDCCDDVTFKGDPQKLLVRVSDGGGGAFITIETKRWAIDSAEELSELIRPLEKLIRDFPEQPIIPTA